jgi:uncharacterized protein (DUF1499 family)
MEDKHPTVSTTKRHKRSLILGIAVVIVAMIGMKGLALYSASVEPAIGLTSNGQLLPSPDSPNGLSTESADSPIAPLPYGERSPEDAREKLRDILVETFSADIQTSTDVYLHATVQTPLLGFVDDLEARFDDERKVIHLRSASRVGHSDLGANQKRLERLTEAWKTAD